MNSKMREALQEAWLAGCGEEEGITPAADDYAVIDRIAQRYGDLEFTREEVRGMLEEMRKLALKDRASASAMPHSVVNEILSRHLGESESGDKTPTIKASEIDAEHNPETPWPDPKSSDLIAEDFNLIWGCIKSWDINVPEAYKGYCGATGNHVMQILFALGRRDITDYWENGGSIPEPQHTLDREVGEIQGELILLTRRVAAIEQWILAKGGEDIGSE